MTARTPEDVDRLFAEALNAGNLDGLVALYEPEASLSPAPGKQVSGHAAIREALAGFLAAKPRMDLSVRVIAQSGALALCTARWTLAMTGQDGKPQEVAGQSIEVVRRQADGRWLFAIDEPFGMSPGA
jgi:uncharacterized protein (TIGR02246 family)